MISSYTGVVENAASTSAAAVEAKKKTEQTQNEKSGSVSGKTIGSPKLSKKAADYYESLKKKYSNMDFILVSEDQKETAKAQAGSYANASKTVVLIDEDKIERMAEDENYRKQYEGIIGNAASGLSQLKSSLSTSGADVKGYGMQVNDGGTASFFAVLKKSSNAQKERIEKKKEAAKAEKKAEEKRAKKKEQEERLKKKEQDDDSDDTITITASSIEELIKKIEDYTQNEEVNNVQTKEEKAVGQHIDFKG